MYHLMNNQGVMTPDSTPAECSVPWLNDVLVFFTIGLQLCQQLKDKVHIFLRYFHVAIYFEFTCMILII